MSLVDEAAHVEVAADLLRGPPAELARRLLDALGGPDLAAAPPRALWNLLWLAGELSVQVDVYRAGDLLSGVERLLASALQRADGERADAAEMAFDFFFNRPAGESPLVVARLDATLTALQRLLAVDGPVCRRAALHGLGHLRQQLDGAERDCVDALLDGFVRQTDSTVLAQYAVRARAGELL